MKILFLDIDGVVLPNRAHLLPNQTSPIAKIFDPCAVSLLNDICLKAGYKIVIHSSWLRYYYENLEGYTVKEWCIQQGIKEEYFHEDAECDGMIHWRYNRVRDWLSRHDVTEYVILDDVHPEINDPVLQYHIPIDEDEGITMELHRRLTYQTEEIL